MDAHVHVPSHQAHACTHMPTPLVEVKKQQNVRVWTLESDCLVQILALRLCSCVASIPSSVKWGRGC